MARLGPWPLVWGMVSPLRVQRRARRGRLLAFLAFRDGLVRAAPQLPPHLGRAQPLMLAGAGRTPGQPAAPVASPRSPPQLRSLRDLCYHIYIYLYSFVLVSEHHSSLRICSACAARTDIRPLLSLLSRRPRRLPSVSRIPAQLCVHSLARCLSVRTRLAIFNHLLNACSRPRTSPYSASRGAS